MPTYMDRHAASGLTLPEAVVAHDRDVDVQGKTASEQPLPFSEGLLTTTWRVMFRFTCESASALWCARCRRNSNHIDIAGRGHTAMKGFSEPVPIFTVQWRGHGLTAARS
jgi:hypothetical protein